MPAVEQLLDSYLGSRKLPDWIACQQQGLNGVRLLGHLSTRRRKAGKGDAQASEDWGLDYAASVRARSDKMIYSIVGEALERAEQLRLS